MTSWHLLVQSQQWKYKNHVWNLINFKNKIPERRSVFIVNFEQTSHIEVPIVNFD